jgi:biopolymer transport protein ExbD
MASAVGNDEGPMTAINVTPLVDILLVVLIIFMATAPLIGRRAMKVDVPRAAHHDRAATDAVQIVLNAKKQISVGGRIMTQEAMAQALAQTVRMQPDVNITFSADKALGYGDIIAVIDAIRGAGVRKIGLEVVNK